MPLSPTDATSSSPPPDTAHTSQNALDSAGAYRSVTPWADCQGIETVVILKSDGTSGDPLL